MAPPARRRRRPRPQRPCFQTRWVPRCHAMMGFRRPFAWPTAHGKPRAHGTLVMGHEPSARTGGTSPLGTGAPHAYGRTWPAGPLFSSLSCCPSPPAVAFRLSQRALSVCNFHFFRPQSEDRWQPVSSPAPAIPDGYKPVVSGTFPCTVPVSTGPGAGGRWGACGAQGEGQQGQEPGRRGGGPWRRGPRRWPHGDPYIYMNVQG